jgi:hypothetical protein
MFALQPKYTRAFWTLFSDSVARTLRMAKTPSAISTRFPLPPLIARGTCDLCNAHLFSWILKSAEICYNLRYFEPHGRQLADPWSCRQSAIHQKLYLSNQHSAWTIIHTPLTLNDALRDSAEYIRSHPIGLHVLYIRSCMHYWKEYLGFLGSQLRDLVSGGQRIKISALTVLTECKGLYRETIR